MKYFMAIAIVAALAVPAAAHFALDTEVAGTYYLPTESGDSGVWEETNGLDGLQQTETVLEDNTVVPADTRIA